MKSSVNSKIAIITGAAGGIGSAILKEFLIKGYFCVVTSSNKQNLKKLKKKFKDKVHALKVDLTNEKDLIKFKSFLNKTKSIHSCINCAGINIIKNFNKVTGKNFDELMKVNLKSVYFINQMVINKMVKQKYGRIINIGSIWSVVSKEKRTLYSTSKSGLSGLSRALAAEYSKLNILTNTISPGFINTKLTEKSLSKNDMEKLKKKIPLKRFGEPEEIADIVYFFGSDQNSYVTGQNILCDGGFSII